jgi:hypothetical protein
VTDSDRRAFSSSFKASDANLNAWYEAVGLRSEPFAALEASADPWLSRYLVDLAAFEAARGTGTSVLLAPAGGGKTALRVRVTQNCWAGQEALLPFPVSYQPPLRQWQGTVPSLDQHLAALSQAGASFLLLALAHRPHWYLDLSNSNRRRVTQAVLWSLGTPVQSYVEPCMEESSLAPLRERFAPGLLPPIQPAPDRQATFFATFAAQSEEVQEGSAPSPEVRWQALLESLLDTLGLPGVYILLDGLDNTRETANDPHFALACIQPLLAAAPAWAEQKVFLKLFIPEELGPAFTKSAKLFHPAFRAEISWTPQRLIEMLQRRIFVASQGMVDSLDQISSPEISNLDRTLVSAVAPRPRDVLVTFQHLVRYHVQSGDHHDPLLQPQDIERALDWYHQDTAPILSRRAGLHSARS